MITQAKVFRKMKISDAIKRNTYATKALPKRGIKTTEDQSIYY